MTPEDRIAGQRELGSDATREALSEAQVELGYTSAIVLFETETEYRRVNRWIWEQLSPDTDGHEVEVLERYLAGPVDPETVPF